MKNKFIFCALAMVSQVAVVLAETKPAAQVATPAAVKVAAQDKAAPVQAVEVKAVEQKPLAPREIVSKAEEKAATLKSSMRAARRPRGVTLEDLKKDPVRYARMTNGWARAAAQRKEQAKASLAALKGFDTKHLGEAEKQALARYVELCEKRDALRESFKPGEKQGPEQAAKRKELFSLQGELRKLGETLRPALEKALFREAGADEATAAKLSEKLQKIQGALR